MIAYKGFHKNLTCTMGHGTFQYEVGKTYKEDRAQCAEAGFHCVEEPIEVLSWYSGDHAAYCIVDAGGDINEDGDNRISCTEMTVLKEVTLQQLGILECRWMQEHPTRKYSRHVKKDRGEAEKNGIVIVRGKNPMAAGGEGATIFILKEGKRTKDIKEIGVFPIDGVDYMPDTFYNVKGEKVVCGKKN